NDRAEIMRAPSIPHKAPAQMGQGAILAGKLASCLYGFRIAYAKRHENLSGNKKGLGCMSKFDVLTVRNAIVDILARCDDGFLSENGIIKGAMNLIDAERAELLYSKMGPAIE